MKEKPARDFIPVRIAVLAISYSRNGETGTSGKVLAGHAQPVRDTIDTTRMPTCLVQDIAGVILAVGRGRRVDTRAAQQSATLADFSAQPEVFLNLNPATNHYIPETAVQAGVRVNHD